MKKIIFVVIFAVSISTLKAQIRYTGYLYAYQTGAKERFEYSVSTLYSDGAYKTIYRLFKPGSSKNRYTITASHFKEDKKIVVEVNDEQYILTTMTGKEETTYEVPSPKPFGIQGTVAILDKAAPVQLAVQFLSGRYEYVKVLVFLGSSQDDTFEYFMFNRNDNIPEPKTTIHDTKPATSKDSLPEGQGTGKSTNNAKVGKPQAGFTRIDREAEFPGGNMALSKFLQENLKYPDTAGNNNIQGIVLVQFTVNEDGSIGGVEVIRGNELGYGLPEEAVRVISIMPKWIPAQQGGNNIKSFKKMPVVFHLTEEDAKPLTWFTGAKKFCDEDDTWYYKVSIAGNNITLQSYPGEKNTFYKNKAKPVEVIHGVIRGDKIVTPDPPKYKTNRFKFENGVLYEVNNEDGYNEYKECH